MHSCMIYFLSTFFLSNQWAPPWWIISSVWVLSCSSLKLNTVCKIIKQCVQRMCTLIILWTKSRELRSDRELYVYTSDLNTANLVSLHVIFPVIKLWLVRLLQKESHCDTVKGLNCGTICFKKNKHLFIGLMEDMLIWLETPETGNVKH